MRKLPIDRIVIPVSSTLLLLVFLLLLYLINTWVFSPLPYEFSHRERVVKQQARTLATRLLRLDGVFYHALSRFRNDSPSDSVVLLDIGYDVVISNDAWPLPRNVHADLFTRLATFDPRMVVVDAVFEWPQAPWVMRTLNRYLSGRPQQEASLLLAQLNHDGMLKEALKKLDCLLLYLLVRPGEVSIPALQQRYRANLVRHALGSPPFEVVGEGVGELYPYARAHGIRESILPLQLHAKGTGYSRFNHGRLGVAGQAPLFHRLESRQEPVQNYYLPHLAAEAVRLFLGQPGYSLKVDDGRAVSLAIGEHEVFTDAWGEMTLNFYPSVKGRSLPVVKAHDLITGKVPKKALKGKIVVVGSDTNMGHDYLMTPQGRLWGTRILATAISNILKRDHFYRPLHAGWIEAVSMGIAFMAILAGALQLRPLFSLGIMLLLLTAMMTLTSALFLQHGQMVSVTLPVVFMATLYFQTSIMRYLKEERQKRFYKNALGLYLSPALSEQVAENPDLLGLDGREEELTVLFSDIRGFTSISETMEPEALTSFLHQYFSPMTDIVFDTGGTLDKYIGDAIMAFWGAPVYRADHADQACRAALAMVAELDRLQEQWQARGLPKLTVGIGIHTGRMRVGNMGSDRRLSYTVMGDSVNLGSRLEGLSKVYGVQVIASGDTWEKVKGNYYGRLLERVRVKGKAEAVAIYEVMGEGSAPQDRKEDLGLWQQALEAYGRRDWDGAEHAFTVWRERHQDLAAALYLEDIRRYRHAPPPEDWHPLRVMTTK